MKKRLTRSKENKIFAGVFGGLGEYADLDPVLLRLGYIIMTAFTGFAPGILAYILSIFIVPASHDQRKV